LTNNCIRDATSWRLFNRQTVKTY